MAHDEPIIRDIGPGDEDDVRAVNARAVAELRRLYRPTRRAVEESRARPVAGCLVAEVDGRIVGTLRWRALGDRFHLLGPLVEPAFRRRGIARALVEALADRARRTEGAARLSLWTVTETGNVQVFERLGFRAIEVGPAADLESVDGTDLTETRMERPV
jgi:GNAT superfamily N-acetyltransferase